MPAHIVQPNTTPFADVAVDSITLDIIENALRNARAEMDAVLFRTAMSPGIREQHDAFPMIANHQGKMVVGQFGSFIHGFVEGYDGTIEEGDVFLTNDPYSCNGAVSHLNDWLAMMPIFHGGRLVSWAAMFGHMTDNGGKVPGSLPTDAAQIFEEGLQIPPVKIVRGGELNTELLGLLLRNSRVPEWNRSDFNAILASLRLAERRVHEIVLRFGVDETISAMLEMLARNKRAMSAIVQMVVPEKKAYFEDYIDDDGVGMGPYKVACSLWRTGDVAHFDFTGTDPQSISSVNFYLNEEMFKMFLGAFVINLFDPQILFNDGFYDLVQVTIPEGTILKPKRPAALSCRTHMLGRIFDIMGGVLGQGAPEALNAAGFSDSPHLMYSGYDTKGDWYQLFQIGFGGIPGRPSGDGPDGHSLWPSFTNVPNEYLESYFPLRIVTYESIADSGGAGLHRGGNGVRTSYEFLEPGDISIHDDRWLTYPWGVNGGTPGARSRKQLVRVDGSQQNLPSKCDRVHVEPGDVLHFDTWGGGGWGDPLQRAADQVALDVRRGLVTPAGARRYGVVLDHDAAVDVAATEALRTQLRSARGGAALPLFDRGGTIEELKARCLEETGFPPPESAGFRKLDAQPHCGARMTEARVHLTEVGLRDGLQSQPTLVALEDKLRLAEAIAACGYSAVEATSFVSKKSVPQMADADALFPRLPDAARIRYSALTPNLRAFERALAAGVPEVAVVLSATETMNRRNINMGLDAALDASVQVLKAAQTHAVRTRAYVAVAFGCPFEGEVDASHVLDLAARLDAAGADEIVIADTIGAAHPAAVGALFGRCISRFDRARVVGHFHDTRGFALANVWAAYLTGVRRFDASLGGLGGCPFAPGAAGNVATEDLVLMFEGCGIETGIDLPALRRAIALAERLTGLALGGRTARWLRAQDAGAMRDPTAPRATPNPAVCS